MASSSDRLSPHQQALMAMLDQAAAQLGLDRGAIQRAKQQVAMIPPDRVAAALQKVAVRSQPRPLRGPVSPSRPPEMGRGDERMLNEFAKIQDQRTLFSKDTRTPGTYRSRGAASTLPPERGEVYGYKGGLNKSPVPLSEAEQIAQEIDHRIGPLPESYLERLRRENSDAEIRRNLKEPKPKGYHNEIRDMVKGRTIKDRLTAPKEIDEKKLQQLINMKKELRAKGASQFQMAMINNRIAQVVGAGFTPILRSDDQKAVPPRGDEVAEIRRKTALDMEHGIHEGEYTEPITNSPYGKRLGPDERSALTMKKDTKDMRAREIRENREAENITVDKAFEELNETREGDRADAAKGLQKHERRPVDQKDPERAAWQTKLREISDNRKPMPEAERRAKFEKVATEEYRKVPWKKQSKYVADMMNEATLIDNELAKSLVEKNPAMGKTFIGRLAFFVEQNPNDVDAKAALEQARKGNFGAAVAYNRAGFSVKMGNKDFERSARHQAESAEKTQGRFATRETIEGRDELDRGEENRGDSEAVEKGRKKDLSQVDQEGAAAAKYEQDLDKERPGRNVYTKGDLDLEGTDKALERKYAAESPSKKKAFLWDRKNKRPYLAGPAKKRVESQVTEEMAYQLKRVSRAKLAAAAREEPMLFQMMKALLKRGH